MRFLRRSVLAVLVALAVPAAAGCGIVPAASGSGTKIVIGAYAFTESRPSAFGWALPWAWSEASGFSESQVLAELYAAVLRKAGYDPTVRTMRIADLSPALEDGRIDVVPSYA